MLIVLQDIYVHLHSPMEIIQTNVFVGCEKMTNARDEDLSKKIRNSSL